MKFLKRIVARLPASIQYEMKRIYFRRQIRQDTFQTLEPEYKILHEIVGPRDWVLDVGANIGHYTKRLSDLVGPEGRVIAFEPISETFAILSANVQSFQFKNVTLINAAASFENSLVDMNIPSFDTGLRNFYQASISEKDSNLSGIKNMVVTLRLDLFKFQNKISLIKIDTEGHELFVLQGMFELLRRDHPILIIETFSNDIINMLKDFGYSSKKLPESPNILFHPSC